MSGRACTRPLNDDDSTYSKSIELVRLLKL